MNDTTTPSSVPFGLPAAAFIAGVDPGTGMHAIPHDYAVRALAEGSGESGALCGRRALVATRVGAFDRATLPTWATVCPHCAWAVAATGAGAVERELNTLTPTGADREALKQLLDDPLIIRHLCEAIIAAAGQPDAEGLDDAVIELLAHASTHAPVLLRSWDCAAEECHHPPGECPCAVACAACSLRAGSWAGEQEGTYRRECTISAPCQVLTTLAAHLNPPAPNPPLDPPADQGHHEDQDERAADSGQAW
ncbi:hypothetical protein AB0K21_42350 [Streptosporangium sp. NPDC049248]|uniref:hypothetical protein n=1 Tax=Streptosporangium sp. NPDC049248 TaxID=3155651 RepID=UPI0034411FB8